MDMSSSDCNLLLSRMIVFWFSDVDDFELENLLSVVEQEKIFTLYCFKYSRQSYAPQVPRISVPLFSLSFFRRSVPGILMF